MGDCLVCSKTIEKKAHESVARYNNKKFCSPICCRHYMRENKLGWFAANKTLLTKFPKYERNDIEPIVDENF